jgi:hypothetical protein
MKFVGNIIECKHLEKHQKCRSLEQGMKPTILIIKTTASEVKKNNRQASHIMRSTWRYFTNLTTHRPYKHNANGIIEHDYYTPGSGASSSLHITHRTPVPNPTAIFAALLIYA